LSIRLATLEEARISLSPIEVMSCTLRVNSGERGSSVVSSVAKLSARAARSEARSSGSGSMVAAFSTGTGATAAGGVRTRSDKNGPFQERGADR
jgi:hypothetical protein